MVPTHSGILGSHYKTRQTDTVLTDKKLSLKHMKWTKARHGISRMTSNHLCKEPNQQKLQWQGQEELCIFIFALYTERVLGRAPETGDRTTAPDRRPLPLGESGEEKDLLFTGYFLLLFKLFLSMCIISKNNSSSSSSGSNNDKNNRRKRKSNLLICCRPPNQWRLAPRKWSQTTNEREHAGTETKCRFSSKFHHKRSFHVLHGKHLPTRRKGFGIQTRVICAQSQLWETAEAQARNGKHVSTRYQRATVWR